MQAVFSYGEALSHGWQMTRKHWRVTVPIMVIMGVVNLIQMIIDEKAGSRVSKRSFHDVYDNPEQIKRLLQDLLSNGYINKQGSVQDKLQDTQDPKQLILAQEFDDQRNIIFRILERHKYRLPFPKSIYYIWGLGYWLLSMLMGVGFVKIFLALARDQETSTDELFSNCSLFMPYILGSILYMLAMIAGGILFIVPGVILAVMLGQYSYVIVDKGLGPIDALKRSRQLTKGLRWRLFVLQIIAGLLSLAGLLCFIIGVLVVIPVIGIAQAYVYDRLEHTQSAVVV